jgi:hypothetical protein
VEGELRRMLSPEAWCAYESMRAGVAACRDAGLAHHAKLAQVPPERLRLAFQQLPPDPVRAELPSNLFLLRIPAF